ncbi:hypothetical protein D3C78_1882840 [compost metagenome]
MLQLLQILQTEVPFLLRRIHGMNQSLQLRNNNIQGLPHDINLPLQLHSKKILKGLKEICFHCIQILSLPLLLQLGHHF